MSSVVKHENKFKVQSALYQTAKLALYCRY